MGLMIFNRFISRLGNKEHEPILVKLSSIHSIIPKNVTMSSEIAAEKMDF